MVLNWLGSKREPRPTEEQLEALLNRIVLDAALRIETGDRPLEAAEASLIRLVQEMADSIKPGSARTVRECLTWTNAVTSKHAIARLAEQTSRVRSIGQLNL